MPLGAEDGAILALESPTIAGHTCKVVRVAPGGPGIDALRARVVDRLELAPPLSYRLAGGADALEWQPAESFDVADHVVEDGTAPPVDSEGLREAVARLFEQRLDRERPLWRMDRVSLADGGSALVWRIHHALADGTAAMRFARALLWDHGLEPAATPAQSHAAHAADETRRRAHLPGVLGRGVAGAHGRPPLDGRIGSRRQVGFAAVPLRPLHDAAKSLDGATLNDALVAVVGGAVRRWVEVHDGRLDALRVRVPVSLHHEGDDASNRDSFFSLPVPLDEPDPARRLAHVHAETRVRKEDHDPERMDELLADLHATSPRLEHLVSHLENSPRRFAVCVSNVPGPRQPVTVLGAEVRALHSLAEIGEHHALRLTAVSLAGRLYVGFCVDPELVPDAQMLADALEAEAEALITSVPAR